MCLFSQLSEEMDTENTCLPFYMEVIWLSTGRSLARVFELLELVQRFLLEKQSPLAACFSDTKWVAKLAYLCDIFNLLNKLNLSLQGRMTTVFKSADKVAAFKPYWNYGAMSDHWDSWHISTISRDFERLSQGLLFPSWYMITFLSFQKSLSII